MRRRTRQAEVPYQSEYGKYKRYLREDFVYECVFCTVHENDLGGPRGMHVEHLRPKGMKRFASLECEYTNLLYACPVCNSYKGRDWPSDNPVEDGKGYPDPCEVDYDHHITVLPNCRVQGHTDVGAYLVRRLHLNRRQLVKIRKKREALKKTIENRIRMAEATMLEAERMKERSDLPSDIADYFARIQENAAREKRDAEAEWQAQREPLFEMSDYV